MAKRLELLKEVDSTIARMGILLVRNQTSNVALLETMTGTAKGLGVQLDPREVGAPAEFERTFSMWSDAKIKGVVIGDNGLFQGNVKAIADLAAKHRLPSIGSLELAAGGGLMAYGVDFPGQFRRAAVYVDKILKGAKAGDLPIEQATKFQLVVNLETAKALGLTIPPSILTRADEVIE
jgi:putative ABC transport system substrate-binding protein